MMIDAPIEQVTVYRSGALVRRCAKATLDTDGELRIGGLPLALADGSVVARVRGGGAPTAVEVRVGLEVPENAQDGVGRDELREARLDLDRAMSLRAHVSSMIDTLSKMSTPDRPRGKPGQPPPMSPTESRLALLTFRREKLASLQDELRAADEQLHLATERIKDVEMRLRLASSTEMDRASELRKTVHVRLRGPAGQWAVEVEYLVPGARWTPSYALWFDADYRSARLVMRASVAQASGEDWSAARLAVSTATPTRWTELPELPARRIGRWQPAPPATGWRALPDDAGALYADYDRARHGAPTSNVRPVPPTSAPCAGAVAGGAFDEMDDDEIEMLEAIDDEYDGELGSAYDDAPPVRSAAPPPPMMREAPASLGMVQSLSAPKRSKKRKERSRSSALPPGSAPRKPRPPAGLTAPTDRLDYGSLRLQGPESSQRGALLPTSVLALYQQTTVSTLTVTSSVMVVVQAAVQQAQQTGSLALPPRCSPVGPIDDFDHVWRAEHPVDVPSDGAWHTVTLHEHTGPTALSYVAVPRESSDAYRVVRFAHPGDAPMAAGPVDVYVDGGFLLTSAVRAVASGGEVVLGLGVEQGIKIARNTRFEEKSRGLLGGSRSLEHSVQVDVTSTLGWPAKLEVRERIPVVNDTEDEITITEGTVTPAWSTLEQDPPVDGGRVWTITVDAGKRVELRAAYAVQISSSHELVGGDRRDR